jgi:hypothetical protein
LKKGCNGGVQNNLDLTVPVRCDTFDTIIPLDVFSLFLLIISNNCQDHKVKDDVSLIYRNIWAYRFVMNMLYLGKYRRRFNDITDQIGKVDQSVVELCFGDIHIASYCKESARSWIGYDINEAFVAHARKNGHHAVCADILSIESLPRADVLIFAGSLYHFNANLEKIWDLMTSCSRKIILSEPVRNITALKNGIGKIGAQASAVKNGAEVFRFDRNSLTQMLNRFQETHRFSYQIVSEKKDILITIHERPQYRHSGL